jgi:hypothetical protein
MGDDGGVVRMTISVPRGLKARMDAADPSVNWSRTAAQAFEAKLLELEARSKESATMDDVIVRLKAAAELEANEDYQSGMEAGRAWAREDASPKELRRLSDYIDTYAHERIDWWDIDHPGWPAPLGATGCFVEAVWPQRKDDRHAPGEFWEQALGDDADRVQDPDFFRGFGEGAVEVWEQVKDRL